MRLTITYSPDFTPNERIALEQFSDAITQHWVQSSGSTSNLTWNLFLEPSEPERTAVLVANDSRKEILREPLYSLVTKKVEKFTDEFCEKARQYRAQ